MKPAIKRGSIVLTIKNKGNYTESNIQRDQIVLFRQNLQQLIKRVVALPGDTLQLVKGQLHIRNSDFQKIIKLYSNTKIVGPWHLEYLLDEVNRIKYKPSNQNWGPIYIPQRNYFVLGDNTSNSRDSRSIGYLREEEISQKILIIF